MRGRFGLGAALAVSACALVVAACGGSDSSSSSSGGGGGSSSSASGGITVTGAKVIDPASMDNPPKGTIHYCTGKDTNGAAHQLIKDFNSKYSSAGYKAVLTEFPASADQQRAQFIQRQQAKSNDCDVFNSDVIWTAEFASQKWLLRPVAVRQQVPRRSTSRRRSRRSTTRTSTGASRRRATRRSSSTGPTR